jgi:hypothetical protein
VTYLICQKGALLMTTRTLQALTCLLFVFAGSAYGNSDYFCDKSGGSIFAAIEGKDAPKMLMMSGGGTGGAWGAGFINGWSEQNSKVLKQLDVITGVSAGAIAATFVYLGNDHSDNLKRLFVEMTNRKFYRKRLFIELPFTNSLYSTKRQRKTLKDVFSNEIIDEVAVRADTTGTLLCVGTVDLESGEFVEWDLTRVAQAGKHALYRKILLAATALPGIFPPVEIFEKTYVDGGVRQNIFAASELLPIESMFLFHALRKSSEFQRWARDAGVSSAAHCGQVDQQSPAVATLVEPCRAAGIEFHHLAKEDQDRLLKKAAELLDDDIDKPTAYIVINGKLELEEWRLENRALPIAVRGLSVLINERLLGNLFRLHYYLGNDDAGQFLGNDWAFKRTEIPVGVEPCPELLDFQRDCLYSTYNHGENKAGEWIDGFPDM